VCALYINCNVYDFGDVNGGTGMTIEVAECKATCIFSGKNEENDWKWERIHDNYCCKSSHVLYLCYTTELEM